ncbi:phospholipase A2 group III [Cochliomyia hominivorax]
MLLKNLNFLINVTIFVTLAGAIYVPEPTGNYKELTNKPLQARDLIAGEHKLNNHYNNDNDDVIHNDGQQQSLFNTHHQETNNKNAAQLLPTPMQEKSYDINDDVAIAISAKNRTDKQQRRHENLGAQPITGLAEQHQHHKNDVLIVEQENLNDLPNTLKHSRQKRQLSDFLIAPNTRWCGRGNTANGTYNHLGGASMADKCCRTHDHCKLYIPGMSNRFDLFNYRPYTLSHCNCDRRFRTCLKMANDEDANTIGKLFFNLVQTQCFILAKEVVCQQRAPNGTCLKEHIKQKAYLRNNKKY